MTDLPATDNAAAPVLDREVLDAFASDVGAAAFPALLVSFRREIATRRDSLRGLLTGDDLEAIEVSAHSLKATARTIGAMALSACAARIETAALAADRTALASAGAMLESATSDCLSALEALSGPV